MISLLRSHHSIHLSWAGLGLFILLLMYSPLSLGQASDSTPLTEAPPLDSQFDHWRRYYNANRFRWKQPSPKEVKKQQKKEREAFEVKAEFALREILKAQPTATKEDRALFKKMSMAYLQRFSREEFAYPHVSALYQRFIKVMPRKEFDADDLNNESTNITLFVDLLVTEDDLRNFELEQFKDQLPFLHIEVSYHPVLVDPKEFSFKLTQVGQDLIVDYQMSKIPNQEIKTQPKLYQRSKSNSLYILPVEKVAEYELEIKAEQYFYEYESTAGDDIFTAFTWQYQGTIYLIYYPRYSSYPLAPSHTLKFYQWDEEDKERRKFAQLHEVTVKPGVINKIKLPEALRSKDPQALINTRYGSQFIYYDQERPLTQLDHFTTDRTVYRPGDRVHFKWIRRKIDQAQVKLPDLKQVTAQLISPNGQVLQSQELKLSPHGSITGHFDLSPDATTMYHRIRILTGEAQEQQTKNDRFGGIFDDEDFHGAEHYIKVEAYRKSPLVMSIEELESDEDYFRFRVKAHYRGGGEANQFLLHWRIQTRDSFILYMPQWDIPFLPSAPWGGERAWFTSDGDMTDRYWMNDSHDAVLEGQAKATDRNHIIITISSDQLKKEAEQTLKELKFEVLGQDSMGNMATATQTINAQSTVMLTARTDAHHYRVKDQLTAHLLIHDHHGKPMPNTEVKLRFSRLIDIEHQQVEESFDMVSGRQSIQDWSLITEVTLRSDAQGKITHQQSLKNFGIGVIRMTLLHQDAKGIKTRNHRYFFTTPAERGSFEGDPYFFQGHLIQAKHDTDDDDFYEPLGLEGLKLIPDRPLYQVGDQVNLLYVGLAKPKESYIHVMGAQTSLTIPIKPTPNQSLSFTIPENETSRVLYIQVFSLHEDDLLMHYLTEIYVDKPGDDIQITLQPDRTTYLPGETVTLDIQTSQKGQALPSEVEIAIVDEAIFRLYEEEYMDLRRLFRPDFDWREWQAFGHVDFDEERFNFYDDDRQSRAMGIFGSSDESTYPLVAPQQWRSRFKDTAYYKGQVTTDAQGRARLTIPLPDDLTQWRITARAISGAHFAGKNTTHITTRQAYSLRLGGSRFYRNDDESQLVVHLSSLHHKDETLRVKLQVEGAEISKNAKPIQELVLAAGKSQSLQWPIHITGKDTLKIKVWAVNSNGKTVDALKLTRPILSRAIAWTESEKKTLTRNAEYKIELFQPMHALTPVNTIEVSLIGPDEQLILQSLPELIEYPYGCVEQTMNRYLPALVVQHQHPDLLKRIPAQYQHLITDKLPRALHRGEQRLFYFQSKDGGWGWWKYDGFNAYMTTYVLWGFQLSEKAGRDIPDDIMERGYQMLIDSGEIDAFAYYVLQQAGYAESYLKLHTLKGKEKLTLYYDLKHQPLSRAEYEKRINEGTEDEEGEEVSTETLTLTEHDRHRELAWLVMAGYHDLLGYIPRISELKKNPKHLNNFQWVKTVSLLLMAHLQVNPKSDEVMACVNELLALHQSDGWFSTLDSAFAILALSEYFKAFPTNATDQQYTVYVNDQPMKLSAGTHQIPFPIDQGVAFKLRYQHQQKRPLNFGWKLKYKNLKPQVQPEDALAHFNAEWKYYEPEQGKWLPIEAEAEFQRGQLLRLSFTYKDEIPKANELMLIIPLHAGIEPILRPNSSELDDDFLVSGLARWSSSIRPVIKDDEIRAPLEDIHELNDLSFIFNVGSSGRFHAPPAHLFMMYSPQTRAITQSQNFVIQP